MLRGRQGVRATASHHARTEFGLQVHMQRLGAQWAPDFVFAESTFAPLMPGPGGGANAAQLAEALSAVGQPMQLAHIVALLLAR